jgi:hypothetical protein
MMVIALVKPFSPFVPRAPITFPKTGHKLRLNRAAATGI